MDYHPLLGKAPAPNPNDQRPASTSHTPHEACQTCQHTSSAGLTQHYGTASYCCRAHVAQPQVRQSETKKPQPAKEARLDVTARKFGEMSLQKVGSSQPLTPPLQPLASYRLDTRTMLRPWAGPHVGHG